MGFLGTATGLPPANTDTVDAVQDAATTALNEDRQR